jgi:hypothetical protein
MSEEVEITPELREQWIFHGLNYGYPPCCVREFISGQWNYAERNKGPWMGSGFVPCAECQPDAREDFIRFVQERILPFRRATQPFVYRVTEYAPLVILAHTEEEI